MGFVRPCPPLVRIPMVSRILAESLVTPKVTKPQQFMAPGDPKTTARGITLLSVIVVVAVLYFARVVFIPLALSILLAFMLAPLVIRFRRAGLGRVLSTGIVVCFAFTVLTVITLFVTVQLADVISRTPEYETNVRKKFGAIKESSGPVLNRLSGVVRDITEGLAPPPAEPSAPGKSEKPVPVEIRQGAFSPLELLQKVLGSIVHIILMASVVVVFVIFILVQREDLRDRFIRLAGESRVHITTQLLDDAARRLSRYLLAQFAINATFGIFAAVGLYFIGIPNPILWGILAALMRYVPYLGIWIAALLPMALAFAVEPGWVKMAAIIALYLGIDLLVYNFAEPLLYGSSTGVSPLAILVASIFWTWLWGPVGLLLATPLTVIVLAMGRYIPSLHFLSVMLGDEQVLTHSTRFYQRMLALDLDEATEIAEEYLKDHTLVELYDELLIPALSLAEEERHRGRLDEERQKIFYKNFRILIEDIAERADLLVVEAKQTQGAPDKGLATTKPLTSSPRDVSVLCIPARDEADALASLMLAQLLQKRGIQAKGLPVGSLASECLEAVEAENARIACVSSVPPHGYMHARYLCRRLSSRFQDLKLVAAVLSQTDLEDLRKRQPAIAANDLASTLKQALAEVLSFVPVASSAAAQPAQ